MRRSILTLVAFFAICIVMANTRRALVIGIGDYPANSGWKKINGDKDIPLVEEMLIANGFTKSNITELKNEQATCAAICQEFENLISSSQAGDIVYIHFSGHGQQITDLNGDEITDHKDEAWIPYDAQLAMRGGKYEGENHLIDDQINSYLHRMRLAVGQNGKIIVVADACHSGDSDRTEDDDNVTERIRGTYTVFEIDNVEKVIQRFKRKFAIHCNISRVAIISAPEPLSIEWIFISACKDNQNNSEYKGNGSLTFAIYNFRLELGNKSLTQICDIIREFYQDPYKFPRIQTPQFEYPEGVENDLFL